MNDSLHTPSRDLLLREIIRNGIAHGSAENPIVSRDGQLGTRWVMSFLTVGLREPWMSTACHLVLDALSSFKGRQLATMGSAASSLVAGCVMLSKGDYGGLLVRPDPKAYGAGRQIEGHLDRDVPVVIIDDAIGTGFSALKCAGILEAAGFEVEGVIALVRFTYDSGYGRLEEHGYRVHAVYDLYNDITPILEPECTPDPLPWRARDVLSGVDRAPDGLSPFALVRRYLSQYREGGQLDLPPAHLATDIPSPGGVWISLRERASGAPLARSGVWRFESEPVATLAELLAEASWRMGKMLDKHRIDAGTGSLGLSLIGPQWTSAAGQLDESRFGILCRSVERPWRTGAALPRMPGILSTAHQLRHALDVGAGLRPCEPFELYRHTVHKLVEPGGCWPSGGRSSNRQNDTRERLQMASRILVRARSLLHGSTVEDGDALFLFDAEHLFLSIHVDDKPRACLGTRCRRAADLDSLVEATRHAAGLDEAERPQAWLQLSVLTDRWSQPEVPPPFTAGRDALGVTIADRETILLPNVAVDENLDATAFAALLRRKADTDASVPSIWSRFSVTNWFLSPGCDAAFEHHSAWLAVRSQTELTLPAAAAGWFEHLRNRVEKGTLPHYTLPVTADEGGQACETVYAEAVHALVTAASALGYPPVALPYDLVPRTPAAATLAYAHRALQAVGNDTLEARVQARMDSCSPRLDPVGYWRLIAANGTFPERAQRWRHAPLGAYPRIVRACTHLDDGDREWLAALVGPTGTVRSRDTEHDDTLVAARTAEALAGSTYAADRQVAERILDRLARLSMELAPGQAAVRASELQTGLYTEHTVAALGAWARLNNDHA